MGFMNLLGETLKVIFGKDSADNKVEILADRHADLYCSLLRRTYKDGFVDGYKYGIESIKIKDDNETDNMTAVPPYQ
jgi:hypothetical protein